MLAQIFMFSLGGGASSSCLSLKIGHKILLCLKLPSELRMMPIGGSTLFIRACIKLWSMFQKYEGGTIVQSQTLSCKTNNTIEFQF